jgi:hypothetical protein
MAQDKKVKLNVFAGAKCTAMTFPSGEPAIMMVLYPLVPGGRAAIEAAGVPFLVKPQDARSLAASLLSVFQPDTPPKKQH